MARIRYIKPEFFLDEDLAELSYETRLTFAGLWCYADKAGRLEDRPKFLKAMLFPYEKIDIEKQLTELSNPKARSGKPFILRYQNGDTNYIQIIKWDKHQKPHHTESESKIPPPSYSPLNKGNGKGNGEGQHDELELSNGAITVKQPLNNHRVDQFPVFIQIPLVDKSEYPITENQLKEFEELYPAIDIKQCLRDIKAWNLANPKNRKTKSGILRHINGWLQKEQNKAPRVEDDYEEQARRFIERHKNDPKEED